MSAADTLRKCVALLKQVDFADCAESPELWHQHGAVLQEAEAVLRDGEKQESVAYLKEWSSVGNAITDCRRVDLKPDCELWLLQMFPKITPLYTHPAPSLQAVGAVPEGWQKIVDAANRYEFIKANSFEHTRQGFDGHYISWALNIPAANEPNDSLDTAVDYEQRFINWKNPYTALQPAAAPSGDVERDAQRYRFLREHGYGLPHQEEELDRRVDAAISVLPQPRNKP